MAWKIPTEAISAYTNTGFHDMVNHIAPIDQPEIQGGSITKAMNQESGKVSGNFIPGSTSSNKIPAAKPINLVHRPRLKKNLIKHSLASIIK